MNHQLWQHCGTYIAANYQEDYNSWNDTALFLEFIYNWFVILTVSSSAAEKRFKDTRKATMRLDTEEMKRNISFLEQTSEGSTTIGPIHD